MPSNSERSINQVLERRMQALRSRREQISTSSRFASFFTSRLSDGEAPNEESVEEVVERTTEDDRDVVSLTGGFSTIPPQDPFSGWEIAPQGFGGSRVVAEEEPVPAAEAEADRDSRGGVNTPSFGEALRSWREAPHRVRAQTTPFPFERVSTDSSEARQTTAEIQDPEGNQMSNTIGHLLGISNILGQGATHPLIVGNEVVGIEIELERAPMLNMTYWNTIPDGSLRNNGQEYVMKQPLGGEALRQAIMEVDRRLAEESVDPSWRCSTHGHFNVLNDTVAQLKREILAYICYEPIMYQCSGIHRWNNIFCPSFGFAQHQLMGLAKIWHLDGINFLNALREVGVKYSGLNILPIFSQGSIEFRGAEAKYKKGQLFRFVNRFLSLKKFAKEWEGTDSEMITHMQTANISTILQKSLPRTFVVDEALLQQSVLNAFDVITLGEFKRPNADTEVVCSNREYWNNFFGIPMPETISLGELQELIQGYSPQSYRGHLDSWVDEDGDRMTEPAPSIAKMGYFVNRSSVNLAREFSSVNGIRW